MANVLIVDDNVKSCRPLVRLLEVVGHNAFFVHDGRTALAMLDQVRPDMILLDVMMPGMDGIEVLKIIRQHPLHKHLPVVVYSARDDNETIDNALQSGAQDYLVKSQVDFDRVQSCIEEHLGEVH
jgi:two-component system, OmpR family, alkaline phosphatase synthesis response regulator PhoP